MAKLAVLFATFALFLFLANATIHTTITVDNEDENPWGRPQGSCQQQIKDQDYLNHCQKFMEEQCSGGRCYNVRSSKHLDSCCEQLEQLDRQCRCQGLKQAFTQGQTGTQEMREMQQMTEQIMEKCNMEPRSCDFPYHTKITLNTEENPRGWGTQSCSQQIQRQNFLKHCQNYMEQQCRSSSRGRGCDNPTQHLNYCCQQLEELDRQCRCPGLKQAVQKQLQGGRFGQQEQREMYEVAEKILSKCEIEPRTCNMPYVKA
ncbi:hypothetical protein COLO4_09579 [Corchorus olitorius]|uniref:Bifunctional inhibitor/plant lipid transfer protein/seed storage helical domain-containing protein n=1 Tax=Corchorus olitorius TaxID=93759 RepID=A0A1R3KBM5_9ROSI|nr:hypothetical protein COLO4_09579 [Corchorus olitorius]